MKFFIKDIFSNGYKIQKKLLTYTEEILSGSFIFCAAMLKKSAAIFKKLWKFVKSFVCKIVFYQLFGCLKTKSGPLTRRNAQLPRANHYIFTKSRQELTRTAYDDVRS